MQQVIHYISPHSSDILKMYLMNASAACAGFLLADRALKENVLGGNYKTVSECDKYQLFSKGN